MTRETILGMLAEGFNLNQIAAIHMINKHTLQEILDAGACAPIIEKSKKTPKIDIDPMFTEEEGL
jgi:hypothetical protein